LLDVLLNDAQGRPTTTGGKVRRRPQGIVPIALLESRSLHAEQPAGNTFETVDDARDRVLRRVVDEQGYMLGLAMDLHQLRLEVRAHLFEY
jgi:hypothetical protein